MTDDPIHQAIEDTAFISPDEKREMERERSESLDAQDLSAILRRQEEDDKRRHEESRARGETVAQKCLRENEEYNRTTWEWVQRIVGEIRQKKKSKTEAEEAMMDPERNTFK